MLCNTRQDIVFLIGSKVGLLPRDRFESGTFWDFAALYKKIRLRFEASLSKFGLNSNACRLHSIKEPFAAAVDRPDPNELEISLRNNRLPFSVVNRV